MIIKNLQMNEVLTFSVSVTFSVLTTSQWKALVCGFLEFVFALKGKGGGTGMLRGAGPFTVDS